MGKMIGIDLGTTNSVVAFAGGPTPVVLDSREGKPHIRSVVGVKKLKGGGQEILVGDVADDNWPMAPHDTVYSVKRLMGRGIKDPEVVKIKQWAMYDMVQPANGTEDSLCVVMGGKQYSPAEISAMILRKAKQDAEQRLGEEVTHAVITVPAYFSQRQRDETREAGWKAGLKVSRILDEPTAAAIAFGTEHGGQDGSEPRYILVYDLGGGTFDISVLVTGTGSYAQLDLEGDMWLGGDNFDQLVVDFALERIKAEYDCDPRDNARFMVVLRSEARKAKERLTSAKSASLIISGLLRDADGDLVDIDVEIKYEDFENRARPLIDRTIELTERALKNAGLTKEQVHDVLLAGNATNMPIVQQALDKMFGRDKVRRNIHPKHCVAMGAAIVAMRLGGIVCQSPDPGNPDRECGEVNEDNATVCRKCGRPLAGPEGGGDAGGIVIGGVAPFCYGVQTADDKFNVFIKKNDPYPTVDPQANTFYTQRPGQRMLSIPVYGGDHLDKASLNEKQGEAFAILPRDLPAGTPVHIRLWLDSDGIFDLQAFLNDGFDLRPWVLKGRADQKAVRALERLELEFAAKAAAALPAERERIEAERERAFEQLRSGHAEEAEKTVEDAIVGLQPPPDVDGGTGGKLSMLIGFAAYLTSDFGWALGTDRTYRLNKLVGEAREALASGDAATIERKTKELDEATDKLPEIVSFLLGVRGAIGGRVQPFEPALAANLRAELDQVEDALKANSAGAAGRLKQFAERLVKEIDRIEEKNKGNLRCPKCGHQMQPGQRNCPKCGWDTWVPADKSMSSSSSGSIGR